MDDQTVDNEGLDDDELRDILAEFKEDISGSQYRDWRVFLGLSVEEVADAVEVSTAEIFFFEAGIATLNNEDLFVMQDFLAFHDKHLSRGDDVHD